MQGVYGSPELCLRMVRSQIQAGDVLSHCAHGSPLKYYTHQKAHQSQNSFLAAVFGVQIPYITGTDDGIRSEVHCNSSLGAPGHDPA